MQYYERGINLINNIDFQRIRQFANESISHLSKNERDNLYKSLCRGVALLDTNEEMCQYLFSFGNMHEAKIHDAVSSLPESIFNDNFEIIDWGCGQGLGTICFFDYLKQKKHNNHVQKVTLIEPSNQALSRALVHLNKYLNNDAKITALNKYINDVTEEDIASDEQLTRIHFFSNILDIQEIDLKQLSRIIDKTTYSENYIVSLGPVNPNNQRIDAFYRYFDVALLYEYENSQFTYGHSNKCTYKAKIYKLEPQHTGNIIPLDYYPSVQFHSAYQLDSVTVDDVELQPFFELLSIFEVSTLFDIGANIYDDIHPVFAVLNNIITRGLPTKASPYIEELFEKTFGFSNKYIKYGTITFPQKEAVNLNDALLWCKSILLDHNNIDYSKVNKEHIQIIFSPLAIARIQKTVLEALITGKIDINSKKWKIFVKEKDVPCAAIAFKDLEQMFNNLTALSKDYNNLVFPDIELDIISNNTFVSSELHLSYRVLEEASYKQLSTEYDLVIEISIFESFEANKEEYSHYKCKNNCYFKIFSAENKLTDRTIYTTDKITYRQLVTTDTYNNYYVIDETRKILEYFLKLLFRKESFRDGQLPILNRALLNKNVIGLLPTGGGKSLTYQLAAMLQPGVTLIVDPLKSLMKDQYDGLINAGIDSCAYINSTLAKEKREEAERSMEQSKLLFVFLSPERLAIYSFRKRLRNMHELNVYFSYGVIDEVHCVSEWGHDFRFSYLHLGRNLYNYVRAKNGEISLFGLTATASFDVLADVERELSGNGAFPLDSETIVRYENSNRLELQYKVEKVKIEFDDEYVSLKKSKYATDTKINGIKRKYKVLLDNNLPLPVKISAKYDFYDAKSEFLKNYIKHIPSYINEIQTEHSINNIKITFQERQGITKKIEDDIKTNISENCYSKKLKYDEAGIIFCPHKKNTGISVENNKIALQDVIPDIGTFTGGNEESDISMENLEKFKADSQQLMVATKAFGMGIDKPNVRFTVNMNYSSSVESFVQEAGRGGRDRKIALSVILLSDYELARVNKKYPDETFPLKLLKGRWFKPEDLHKILNYFNFNVNSEYIDYLTPENDLVRLYCTEGLQARYFDFQNCNDKTCWMYKNCQLRQVPTDAENWIYKDDLFEMLKSNNLEISNKHVEYQNADYETVLYFYNNSFKGEFIEKIVMYYILSIKSLKMFFGDDDEAKIDETHTVKGFLNTLSNSDENVEIVSFIDYKNKNSFAGIDIDETDIAKAIYRMTCIELIEDFTQDYINNRYRIVAKRKREGSYYKALKKFLLRYYSESRAKEEINKVYTIKLNKELDSSLEKEIFKCLNYLTTFVYEKISLKRKRAIDDMRTFCIIGADDSKDWKDINEDLKDFIYYYFNSKYAKLDYTADNGEDYSITIDTDNGKISEDWILFKYLKIIDDTVEQGTPIDNIKHLQGAVRLLRRSLTDDNPALFLLNAFCIFFLGTNGNVNLIKEVIESYQEGLLGFYRRLNDSIVFWTIFNNYNTLADAYMQNKEFITLAKELELYIHGLEIEKITNKYLEGL